MRGLIGLDNYESQMLLELLQRRITAPENTIRWNWVPVMLPFGTTAQPNIVRSTTTTTTSLMHRITLIGDVPVDVHATPSTVIRGAPLEPIAA